jgi:hypothetical protein
LSGSHTEAEGAPDWREVESEAGDRAFSFDGGRLEERFGLGTGAEYFDNTAFGVYEPGELGTVGCPFAHFGAENGQAVPVGTEFNHEVGAEMPEPIDLKGG